MRRWIAFGALSTIACGPFFYLAPPSVGTYPERVATKSWQQLFNESSPADPLAADHGELAEACLNLSASLRPLDTAARLKLIDELISENRAGSYSAERSNFLHEARELAADPALFETAADYIQKRAAGSFAIPPRPPEEKPWDMDDADFRLRHQDFNKWRAEVYDGLLLGLSQTTDALRPYWLVRKAAFLRRHGSPTEAISAFDEVAESYPDHPRGEVAMLMAAVVRFERARADHRHALAVRSSNVQELQTTEAEEKLTAFISQYPKGRFTPDAWGWLAAISYEHGRYGEAVDRQIKRLEMQPTREITRSVIRECDFIFERIFENTENDDFLWIDPKMEVNTETIARHPILARLFLQHALDPAAAAMINKNWYDNESADRWRIHFLNQRIFQSRALVRTALDQLGAAMLRQSTTPDRTTLLLLAWASTTNGEHEQALGLLDRIEGKPDDETLHARAIICQRLGRHPAAVATFDELEKSFPQSPLNNDLRQRRAISQIRSGQSGKAVAAFMPDYEEPEKAGTTLRLDYESPQWCDTILQFAPLAELEATFNELADEAPEKKLLGDALRTRHLARHDFKNAKRFLSTGPVEEMQIEGDRYSENAALHLDANEWEQRVSILESLYVSLEAESDSEVRRELHLKLGREWMKRRGEITLPCLNLISFANSETEKQELLRRRNAIELGFERSAVNEELDLRDEITHALRHFLEAAKSTDPKTGAPALELANECLFRSAEFSRYGQARALETGASKLSTDIRRQLRERFPATREANRSVSYVLFTEPGPWMPGDYNPSNSLRYILSAIDEIAPDAETDGETAPEAIVDGRLSLDEIRRELITARDRLLAGRIGDGDFHPGQLTYLNQLDDQIAATMVPGVSKDDFFNYKARHFNALPAAFESLVEFRKRADPVEGEFGPVRTPLDNFDGWNDFLKRYPGSPKAEAASLRRIRSLARDFRSGMDVSAFHFPEAPIPNGYKRVQWSENRPSDPQQLLKLIQDHESRFPEGRYRSDLNLWKSGALTDTRNFSEAVSLLIAILKDPHQPDLHPDAALHFCDICQRLLDPEQRVTVAAALHENPDSLVILRKITNGDTYLSRLRPLMAWLEEK